MATWDDDFHCYVNPEEPLLNAITGAPLDAPTVHPAQATWTVRVRPKSIWVHREARAQLALLRRPFLEDDGHSHVLGALDEADAQTIAERATRLSAVQDAVPRKLSRISRWRLRQQFLGNYGSSDPTAPP